jgi:hypothetical protein
MLKTNSVFIIGAGSSKEYGYPIWGELKPKIEQYLDLPEGKGDPFYLESKLWLAEVTEEKTLDQVISEKNKAIRQKLDPSKTEGIIWKAIASIFFDLEKQVVAHDIKAWVDVYVQNVIREVTEKYSTDDQDWDVKIIKELRAQFDNVYFITFNYDRLLEYKVKDAILNRLKEDINNDNLFALKIESVINSIYADKFFHPHGIVNPYANMNDHSKIDKNRIPNNISYFGQANDQILNYSPGLMASCFDCKEESGSFLEIKNLHIRPEDVYILGNSSYGLKNNLKKLPCLEWADSVNRVICTSYNQEDQEDYIRIIHEAFQKEIELVFYKTCSEFIEKTGA